MNEGDHSILEDEGSGYLVSVSDIMAGLLFVFIITLLSFVIHFQDAADRKQKETKELETQTEELVEETKELKEKKETTERVITRLTNNRSIRDQLLRNIQARLKEQGIRVSVDEELGVLRLTEETVRFRSMSSELDEVPRRHLRMISAVLNELLPCYTTGVQHVAHCDADTRGKLEAVFIEGHTDNKPFRNSGGYTNWDLSAKRAIGTYQFMIEQYPELARLKNASNLPLFSVAGYAEQRPVVPHDVPTDDERNRRIDIRFIMTPPSREDIHIVEEIRQKGVN
jgi:flagellar motor protein MotB